MLYRSLAMCVVGCGLLGVPGASPQAAEAAPEDAIKQVLNDQVAAWNKGDLDGFMAGYWNDDGLTFISGGDITSGWKKTKERYEKRSDLWATLGECQSQTGKFRDARDSFETATKIDPSGASLWLGFGKAGTRA